MDHWYKLYPWIHFCPTRGKVLCFYCARAGDLDKGFPAKELAFISDGMNNWKKALEKFAQHGRSDHHLKNLPPSNHTITEVLQGADAKQESTNKASLMKIITSVMYLARQGLALRGHESDEGNFVELLKLRASDCPELEQWLKRKDRYTHSDIQNELLQLASQEVLRSILSEMCEEAGDRSPQVTCFSIIVDGTQDISGEEQESICVRYVDQDFNVHEEFLGFYQTNSTTGAQLARLIEDALCRLNLPLARLRGLAFDGAANMAGSIRGAQAVLREKQPMALFVHCGAHCVNLVAKDSCEASVLIRNALYTLNEVGRLFGESAKFRDKFTEICVSEGDSPRKLRPLCPTRWAVRLQAVEAAIDKYDEVLRTVEELGAGRSHVAARAASLHTQLRKKSTLLALLLARAVFSPLDRLSKTLQKSQCSVSQLLSGVQITKKLLQAVREEADNCIQEYVQQVNASSCDVEITLPREKHLPARYAGVGEEHPATNTQQYLRRELLLVLDAACTQLADRFDQEGIREHSKVERVLLTGNSSSAKEMEDLLKDSPWSSELCVADLVPQLKVLFKNKQPGSVDEALAVIRALDKTSLQMFPDAVKLVRLLLTLPASSATAERSFSALRRLKTWLRATMGQARLSSVAVCHVHRERLARVSAETVAASFIRLNPRRERVFGRP